jgi:hypothetical protein
MPQPTVAIIGASADRSKFGNKSVRAHLAQGYRVFPVNPKGGEIEGIAVYKSLAEVPAERLDRISMYVPPAVGRQGLRRVVAQPGERQRRARRRGAGPRAQPDHGLQHRRRGRRSARAGGRIERGFRGWALISTDQNQFTSLL